MLAVGVVAVVLVGVLVVLAGASPSGTAAPDTPGGAAGSAVQEGAGVAPGPLASLGADALGPTWLGEARGPREQLGGGWQRRYAGGMLYWSAGGEVAALRNGAVLAAYRAAGGPGGPLGFPITDEAPVAVTAGSTLPVASARVASFRYGMIVDTGSTDVVGAVVLTGPEWDAYRRAGGPGGPLRLPTAAVAASGEGRVAALTAGSVYVRPDGRALVVGEPMRSAYEQHGGPTGALGWPTAEPEPVPVGVRLALDNGILEWTAATGSVATLPLVPPAPATATAPARGAPKPVTPTIYTTAQGAVTRSYYMTVDGVPARDQSRARATGCADAKGGVSGLRVLALGAQELPGIRRPGLPTTWAGKHLSYDAVGAVSRAWIDGFIACRPAGVAATVVLGTNNYEWAQPTPGSQGGALWARLVDGVASWSQRRGDTGIVVAGGTDVEPAWGPPARSRDWVAAYTRSTSRPLVVFASADGCPALGSSGTTCMNGWSVADLHYVTTGAGPAVYVAPQIYRTDGLMARQWARISQWGVAKGDGPVRFAGVMSQQHACGTSAPGECAGIDNAPAAAWTQMRDALAKVPGADASSLPGPTDIGWMR